jgi:hypothetical protein
MAYLIGQLIGQFIGTAVVFQGLLWVGREIGSYIITYAKPYRLLFRSNPVPFSPQIAMRFSNSKLREFFKYARLWQGITEEHKIYIAKIYWHIVNVILVSILLFLALGIDQLIVLPLARGHILDMTLTVVLKIFSSSIDNPWFVLLLGFINLFFPLRKLLRLKKRYSFDSQVRLLEDERGPILYLRSFYQDTVESDLEVGGFVDEFTRTESNLPKKSPEERLVAVLTSVGPVVAVGKPKEKLPQLGTIRFYFDDSDWQEKVEALMKLSQIVVIQAGHSHGTEWEMLTAIKLLNPERLIFSFVHWQTLSRRERQLDYEIFRMQVSRIYRFNLPEKINSAYFMYFRNDWVPRFACIKGWKKYLLSRGSTLTISEAMKQILNHAAV